MMSFSAETKNELCHLPLNRPCCVRAEAYGCLLFGTVFSDKEIRLTTEHDALMRRLRMLLSRAFGIATESVRGAAKQIVRVTEPEALRRIFETLGYDYKSHICYHLNRNIIENECCEAAFLRGAFLMSGTVAGPEKKSHLEITTGHPSLCRETMSLMLDMQLSPKSTERRSSELLYFKDSTRIEDFLVLIGAQKASLSMMEAKVEKNLHNTTNRQANCDAANYEKAADASARQVAAIQRVLRRGGMELFPAAMRETVQMRLQHPTATLSELAALFEPAISKPGLSHRLRKIMIYADRVAPADAEGTTI